MQISAANRNGERGKCGMQSPKRRGWEWRPVRVTKAASVALILVAAHCGGAAAQTLEEFYSGRQIKFVIGSAGGGGYEFYSRLLGRYMSRYLPGNPLFVVQAMPGAAGMIAANYLYNIAPRDGSEMGMVGRAVGIQPLIDPKDPGPRYVATKFNWIGTPQKEVGLVLVRASSPIRTLEDLTRHELVVSGTSAAAPPSYYPRLMNKLLGTKFKVVDGYKSSQAALLALERGEVDGHTSGSSAAPVRARIRPWIQEGKIRVVAQIGLARDPEYPDAPLVIDLARQEIDRQILAVILSQQSMAWPIAMPPDVPAARVAAMRAAFDAAMVDPNFIADAAKQKLILNPASGKQIHELLERVYRTPKAILDRLVSLSDRG
jgi:tripartite-type tricarboxylate transporter receptor subunit TctC